MDEPTFRAMVAQATLAPSVHNIQGWRWALRDGVVLVGWSLDQSLAHGDPDERDAGLSCGAAVEGAVIALAAQRMGAELSDLWLVDDRATLPGCRLAARIAVAGHVALDPLAACLEVRFTHRGAFLPTPETPWLSEDAVILISAADKAHVAALNDRVSLTSIRHAHVRRELLSWMRLSPSHPRAGIDGMDRAALRMSAPVALAARASLGPLWPMLDRFGLTGALTAEAALTQSAAAIACFHRPVGESPVASGRAYLRLCLEATMRGYAGWPMAALADDPATRAALSSRIGLGPDRRLIQVLRFGQPDAVAPPRARRPLSEIIL